MADPTRPIAELVRDVKNGKITARSLAEACLRRIKETEEFHAVLEINPAALERADEVDRAVKSGTARGKLLGVPYIAKDNFLTANTHTTAASKILEPFEAPYQATVIEKLEAEGAILIAKANMDAFAHGSSTENSDFGPTKNPHDLARVPGGSSGGSAAAVALGQASFAIGTDTGGSIRQPASFCGIVGLKPTYGLISRYGVIAMASSTDVIGPMTRTVEDAAIVLNVLAGRDPKDATTIERAAEYANIGPVKKTLKIGVIKEYMADGIDPAVKKRILEVIDAYKANGAEVEEVSLPAVEQALACYYIIAPAEISSNLARYDGIKFGYSSPDAKNLTETYFSSRNEGLGTEAKRRILIGTYVLSSGYYDAYYKKAQKVRTLLIRQFQEAFEKYDILVGPTTPTTAFKLGENDKDPLAMYLSDVTTVAVNLVGAAAISVPAGKLDGLPVGFQIIAPQQGEADLLAAAKACEEMAEEV